jgi:hypothetical protein
VHTRWEDCLEASSTRLAFPQNVERDAFYDNAQDEFDENEYLDGQE